MSCKWIKGSLTLAALCSLSLPSDAAAGVIGGMTRGTSTPVVGPERKDPLVRDDYNQASTITITFINSITGAFNTES